MNVTATWDGHTLSITDGHAVKSAVTPNLIAVKRLLSYLHTKGWRIGVVLAGGMERIYSPRELREWDKQDAIPRGVDNMRWGPIHGGTRVFNAFKQERPRKRVHCQKFNSEFGNASCGLQYLPRKHGGDK